jgi:hypothetical protein
MKRQEGFEYWLERDRQRIAWHLRKDAEYIPCHPSRACEAERWWLRRE